MAERVDFPEGVVSGWKRGETWDADQVWGKGDDAGRVTSSTDSLSNNSGHRTPARSVGRGLQKADYVLKGEQELAQSEQFSDISDLNRAESKSAPSLERFATDSADLWKQVSEEILKRLDPQIYSAWIKPLEIDGFAPTPHADGSYALEVALFSPNKFSADHIRSAYSDTIREAAAEVFGVDDITVKISVRKQAANTSKASPAIAKSTVMPTVGQTAGEILANQARLSKNIRTKGASSRFDQTQLNPHYNFSNFVVGNCNQFSHAVSLQVAENLGTRYNPLFIYGGVGLGKTHLVNAIGNASRRRGKNVLMVTSESFVNELIAALRANRMQQFKNRFRTLDLLIIDDVQFIIGKERTQEEFFHTFNELYQQNKQIILTSDKLPQELVGLEERLRTRFASGISADLQAPDFETRVAILIKKAEGMGVALSSDVAQFLSERIDTNVRELEGALNRLIAMSSIRGVEISRSLAEDAFEDFRPLRKNDVSTEFVQKIIAERYSVSVSDLLGKRRTQNIAFARQVAMYLSRKLTPCSFPEIGAFFGGRDHSTVIHAVKVIEERSQSDSGFKKDLDQLIRKITS